MTPPVKVVLATYTLGLGGTEKGLVNHAIAFDPARVDVRVVALRELGTRAEHLRAAGVAVELGSEEPHALAKVLECADVVHVFRSGTAEPLVPEACRLAGVPVIVESNVFGSVDTSSDEPGFAAHLHLSKVSAMRVRAEAELPGPEFHERHRVLHLPLNLEELRSLAPERREAKSALGLDPDRPVVGRVGRDADRNWSDILVDMVDPLVAAVPEVQVVFLGITPGRRRRLGRGGMPEQVTLVEPTFDERRIATVLAACDVFTGAAELGESFGLAISEALALGRPVVTSSTPWHNNGQIEQVDNGVNGYVANHPRAFAEAIADLLRDEGKRERFGAAAAATADELVDSVKLTRELEDLYESLLAGEGLPERWDPSPAALDAFIAGYARRAAAEYRPLTGAERAQARWARVRERSKWIGRAVRGMNRDRAAVLLWTVRGKLRRGR